MFTHVARLLATLALAVTVFACATTGSGPSGGSTIGGDAEKAAVGAIANQAGIGESYVTMALSTARGLLGSGAQKTAGEKADAAQQAVDKTAAKAQTDGNPLSDTQKTTLLDGIKGLL